MELVLCYLGLQIVTTSNAAVNQVTTLAITDTKLYAQAVALLNEENVKLVQQSKSGLKYIIFLNKYQWRLSTQTQNQCLDYLDYLIEPSF